MHHRQWNCQGCNEVFEARQDFIQHIRKTHSEQWSERQLPIIADICENPRDVVGSAKCPLCLGFYSRNLWFQHLAAHMEELSLFALPKLLSDEEELSSNHAIDKTETKSSKGTLPLADLEFSGEEELGLAGISSVEEKKDNDDWMNRALTGRVEGPSLD
jgi:hypothetical protein